MVRKYCDIQCNSQDFVFTIRKKLILWSKINLEVEQGIQRCYLRRKDQGIIVV